MGRGNWEGEERERKGRKREMKSKRRVKGRKFSNALSNHWHSITTPLLNSALRNQYSYFTMMQLLYKYVTVGGVINCALACCTTQTCPKDAK